MDEERKMTENEELTETGKMTEEASENAQEMLKESETDAVTEAGENALMITPETADWPNKATLFVNGQEHGGRVISKQQNGPVDIQFKQMYAGKVLNESNILHFDSIQELMERRLKK